MTPPFVQGLELSAALFAEVEPILQHHFPGLEYAAARIAQGLRCARFRRRAVDRSLLGAAAGAVRFSDADRVR